MYIDITDRDMKIERGKYQARRRERERGATEVEYTIGLVIFLDLCNGWLGFGRPGKL